jgi:hypothetical protein
MSSCICSGVLGSGVAAFSSRRWRMSALASVFFNAPFNCCTMARGVPLGAARANQPCTSKSLYPSSAKVGTSGSSEERLALVTAIARSLPALTCGSDDGMLSNIESTWPPSRSVTAGALPL